MATLNFQLNSGFRKTWLVTGGAGFIGSHIVEALLRLDQKVFVADNLLTGKRENIHEVLNNIPNISSDQFQFFHGDLRDLKFCEQIVQNVDIVLHQAALGSVPRSIAEPAATHSHNVDGFFNILNSSRLAGVRRFVFASSSSVYGNDSSLPKLESKVGEPLSPYAVTKSINETYAKNFYRTYGIEVVGLRYFNVFGPRQDPAGPYAAVIPRWIEKISSGQSGLIYGDGSVSRDFCYVSNVVEANLLSGLTENPKAFGEVFNIALGGRTTLLELYKMIEDVLKSKKDGLKEVGPLFAENRKGDILHSQANIEKAKLLLGYSPRYSVSDGLNQTIDWYLHSLGKHSEIVL